MTAEVWADVLHQPCPTCGAEINALCTFECNGHVFKRHAPCVSRMPKESS